MNKKAKTKRPISDSILLNIIAIGVVGLLLVILALLFLNIYTRHGENIVVPELKGLQADEAQIMLKSKGLNVEIVDSIFKSDAVPGSIIDQTPKPSNKVKKGRNIYITIHSYNPQQISIPDLVDYSSRQALSLLNSIGFSDVIIEEIPAEYSGLVISVKYRGRTLVADESVPLGHTLTLVVGKTIDQDSLSTDQDYIIPNRELRSGSVDNDNMSSTNNNMDDSFF